MDELKPIDQHGPYRTLAKLERLSEDDKRFIIEKISKKAKFVPHFGYLSQIGYKLIRDSDDSYYRDFINKHLYVRDKQSIKKKIEDPLLIKNNFIYRNIFLEDGYFIGPYNGSFEETGKNIESIVKIQREKSKIFGSSKKCMDAAENLSLAVKNYKFGDEAYSEIMQECIDFFNAFPPRPVGFDSFVDFRK